MPSAKESIEDIIATSKITGSRSLGRNKGLYYYSCWCIFYLILPVEEIHMPPIFVRPRYLSIYLTFHIWHLRAQGVMSHMKFQFITTAHTQTAKYQGTGEAGEDVIWLDTEFCQAESSVSNCYVNKHLLCPYLNPPTPPTQQTGPITQTGCHLPSKYSYSHLHIFAYIALSALNVLPSLLWKCAFFSSR